MSRRHIRPALYQTSQIIDGSPHIFAGNYSPPTQPFNSNNATLEYQSVGSLQAFQQFHATIGSSEVTISLNYGTTIKGPLDFPISPPSRVDGSGG
ncbi:uncharacterized protein BKA55DRAFT_505478 [Fusarium redolens]|uniref:Uncharacterized protein n=1 Tax=Fusarium redolens TaxID=48865 RepID=A0A9P9HKN9_FUSRE|nr:uncharacterized protein BKA55DRAFT_505478 [Fusarium redolens]KAH7259369.1 hypothetical protein BKA55DRAFT_505478 [Fusarium redolens]